MTAPTPDASPDRQAAPCGHVDLLGYLTGTACRACTDEGVRAWSHR